MQAIITGRIPATYSEALDMGYKETETKRMRGYVSRRSYNQLEAPIHIAGGRRLGQLYYMSPAYDSTRYCLRHYMARDNM